jgi:signal transduction histidine kinase
MKLTINNTLKAGIILMILAIATVLFISIRQSQQVTETSNLVSHTQEVMLHIQKLELFGADNEAGARRFVLTPSDDFLESVKTSRKDIFDELTVLKGLVSDNAAQMALTDSLNIYLKNRVDFSEQTITVRTQEGLSAATSLVNTGLGKFYSDQIRHFGDSMQLKESNLLELRKKHNEQSISTFSLILYSVLGSTFLLGIYIINRVGVNITRQHQVEELLRESSLGLEQKVQERTQEIKHSEELYRSLFENMLHGFAYCQAIFRDNKLEDFKYLVANNQYELLIGNNEIAGKKISEVLPEVLHSDPEYAKLITNVVLTGKPERFETWVVPLQKWFSVSLYSPEHGYFVVLMDNISERKAAEQKIKEINIELENRVAVRTEELRKTNEELEAFSYSVSHDLRAPLRGIIGFSNILEEEYGTKLDEEARRVIGVIKNNTSRMAQLIDDLLRFSRTSRHTVVKSDIDMDSMMRQVVMECDKKEGHSPIKWELDKLPPVKGDASMIKQVWVNLISNAVKYSNNNKKQVIEIGAIPTEETMTYFVKDNGVGFDENYANKLFKVFQRLHGSEEFEGTGVGLAIVDKIVTKHGGKVWAKAETGNGATFFFNLPAGIQEEPPLIT